MPSRLEALKAAHPEWCFRCGYSFSINCAKGSCSTSRVIAALVAALEDAEADAESWYQQQEDRSTMVLAIGGERDSLRAQLAASQAALAAAEGALKEVKKSAEHSRRFGGRMENDLLRAITNVEAIAEDALAALKGGSDADLQSRDF